MNPCQPPNCPCFCPTADLPIAPVMVQQGGPAAVIQVPIYGTQPFQVSITTNPTLPISLQPLIASVQVFNGNVLFITTAVPGATETLGAYVATIQVCNACGTVTVQVQIDVVANLIPVVTNCALAQALWTPEARVPTVGDTLLAFTPAGCRALLPPDTCAAIQAFPPVLPTLATQLATADCGLATVSAVLALVDTCAALQAFPAAAPLSPNDQFIVLQGLTCALTPFAAVSAAVDVCTLLQNLPNAVVQPTAAFYGQQGGACFEFLVSDLLALAVTTFPLLAPNGSCLAPSYSFTSSPDSGMFYDPSGVGSVIIGDDNCADFISVGASILLSAANTVTARCAGVSHLILSSSAIPGLSVGGVKSALISPGGTNLLVESGAAPAAGIAGITFIRGGNTLVGIGAGDVSIQGGSALNVGTLAGSVSIAGGAATAGSTHGVIQFLTAGTSRYSLGVAGQWDFSGSGPGVVGEFLRSGGAGASPTWAPVPPAVVAFPLLAPNGSCLAPSYSFTASPGSGMFYTGTAIRIGDDNCTDFIEIGASINVLSAGAVTIGSPGLATMTITGTADAPNVALSSVGAGVSGGSTGAVTSQPSGVTAIRSSATLGGGLSLTGGAGTLAAGSVIFVGDVFDFRTRVNVSDSGTIRLIILNDGSWSLGPPGGGVGAAGQALTSAGAGSPVSWQTLTVALGLNEIAVGTGAGITSDPDFTYDPTTGFFRVNSTTGTGVQGTVTVAAPAASGIFAANNSGAGAGASLVIASGGSTTGVGGATAIRGGQGGAGAAGGQLILSGGQGGGAGTSGMTTLTTQPNVGGGNSGAISIFTGSAAATTGAIVVATGGAGGTSGSLILTTGPSTAVVGAVSGDIRLEVGSATSGNGVGGLLRLRSGAGGAGVGGVGGNFEIEVGTGTTPGEFKWSMLGGLQINTDPGVAGNPLVSGGAGLPPTWGLAVVVDAITIEQNVGLVLTSQANGAGASVGTLTNAPSAGDPVFWLPVSINGTTRFIPAWA